MFLWNCNKWFKCICIFHFHVYTYFYIVYICSMNRNTSNTEHKQITNAIFPGEKQNITKFAHISCFHQDHTHMFAFHPKSAQSSSGDTESNALLLYTSICRQRISDLSANILMTTIMDDYIGVDCRHQLFNVWRWILWIIYIYAWTWLYIVEIVGFSCCSIGYNDELWNVIKDILMKDTFSGLLKIFFTKTCFK